MSANIYNSLRAFHKILYKIGSHVYRHFVVKPRAYCRLVTRIVGDYTVEPRFNEPLFKEVHDITNDILCPGQSYTKMHGAEPR